jgi:CDP-ribitol ribitolphosphotransferase
MDMLSVCDYFISDYSCAVYEAGVMGIPFFFFAYDYDEYMSRRSVYIDYPGDLPGGRMYRKAADLVKDLDAGRYDAGEMKRFIDRYVEIPEGKATDKMIDEIFERIGEK